MTVNSQVLDVRWNFAHDCDEHPDARLTRFELARDGEPTDSPNTPGDKLRGPTCSEKWIDMYLIMLNRSHFIKSVL